MPLTFEDKTYLRYIRYKYLGHASEREQCLLQLERKIRKFNKGKCVFTVTLTLNSLTYFMNEI
jgi:hypothetical protein